MINARTAEPPGLTEILEGARSDLGFAFEIVSRSGLPPARRGELEERIKAIGRRVDDPNLYLAVVGEFSSGKSTFINALLRDPLLVSSNLMTTSEPTEIRHAPELTVSVRFSSKSQWVVLPPAGHLLRLPFMRRVPDPELPQDVRGWLRLVTTDTRVGDLIEAVRVEHPAALLGDGVVVIDTPGTQATDQHEEIVRKIMSDQADVAVVVIPSHTPVPDTLVRFLKDNLGPDVLSGCVFVVTKMVRIDAEERERLLRWVRKTLTTKLGIEEPTVYAASVGLVMDQVTSRRQLDPDEIEWVHAFEELERALTERMQTQRGIVVTDKILGLLVDLFEEVERDLSIRQSEVADARRALDEATIRDLHAFEAEQRLRMKNEVDWAITGARTKAIDHLTGARSRVATEIGKLIGGAGDMDALKAVLTTKAPEVFKSGVSGIEPDLARLSRQVSEAVESVAWNLDGRFAKEYSKLQRLQGASVTIRSFEPPRLAIEGRTASTLAAATQASELAVSDRDGKMVSGAIAGAVVGSVVPGVGTILGGLIGGAVGWLFAPALASVKKQAAEKVDAGITVSFAGIEKAIEDHFASLQNGSVSALERRLRHYREKYSGAVEQLVSTQRHEAEKVDEAARILGADAAEATNRRTSLVDRRRELMAGARQEVRLPGVDSAATVRDDSLNRGSGPARSPSSDRRTITPTNRR